jgi:hypothetical protein
VLGGADVKTRASGICVKVPPVNICAVSVVGFMDILVCGAKLSAYLLTVMLWSVPRPGGL